MEPKNVSHTFKSSKENCNDLENDPGYNRYPHDIKKISLWLFCLKYSNSTILDSYVEYRNSHLKCTFQWYRLAYCDLRNCKSFITFNLNRSKFRVLTFLPATIDSCGVIWNIPKYFLLYLGIMIYIFYKKALVFLRCIVSDEEQKQPFVEVFLSMCS